MKVRFGTSGAIEARAASATGQPKDAVAILETLVGPGVKIPAAPVRP